MSYLPVRIGRQPYQHISAGGSVAASLSDVYHRHALAQAEEVILSLPNRLTERVSNQNVDVVLDQPVLFPSETTYSE